MNNFKKMSNPNTRKSCVVPKCTNTTTRAPEKLFFHVPMDVKMRTKWLRAMKRLDPFGNKSKVYCCEDHFDIENDMENYIKYKLVGGRIKLKKGTVPHKFKCQQENKFDKPERSAVQKRNRIKYFEKLLTNDEASTVDAAEKPEEIFAACCQDETVLEDPLSFEINDQCLDKSKRNKGVEANLEVKDKKPPLTSAEKMRAYRQRQREKQMLENTPKIGSHLINRENNQSAQYNCITSKRPPLTSAEKTRAFRQRQREKRLKENSSDNALSEQILDHDYSTQTQDVAGTRTHSAIMPTKRRLTSAEKMRAYRQRQREKQRRENATDIAQHHTNCNNSDSDMKPTLTLADGTKAIPLCQREKQTTTNSSDVTIAKNKTEFIQFDNKPRTRFDLEVSANIKPETDNDQISFELEFSIKQENLVNLHDNYIKIEEVTIQSSADGTTAWVDEYNVKRENYECDLCHISLGDSESLFQHKQTHESDPLQIPRTDERSVLIHNCKRSDEAFHSAERLKAPINTFKGFKQESVNDPLVMPMPPSKEILSEIHLCLVCDEEFDSMKSLNAHLKIHKGQKRYKCDVCQKLFAYESFLTIHKRMHSGDRPFKCDLCNKGFTRKTSLELHKRVHSGERPFECELCEKKFALKNNLNLHKQIHVSDLPYKCDTCEKKFSQKLNLTLHKRIHTDDPQYRCDFCEKKFFRKNSLILHKWVHSGERPYECAICGNGYTRKIHLARHEREHANTEPLQQVSS